MTPGRTLVVLVVTSAVLAGCGSESSTGGDPSASEGATEPTGIVVTAADGETLEFTEFTVTCQPTHEDDGVDWKTAVRAIGGAGGSDPMKDRGVPAMLIEVDADVADGSTVTLPHFDDFGQVETFVSVFVTHAGPATELSSAVEETAGEIEVVSAGCEPQPYLEVRIDATLHSEYIDGGQVTAEGHVDTR